MNRLAKVIVPVVCIAFLLGGCNTTKRGYVGDAPHYMTVVDETDGYTIYEHDETGVWYFCRDGGYGMSVVVMVNPDGTPYIGKNND
ncbi:MAG: DUF6440 family protein [Ruminiclostridium sp.]